MKQGKKALSLLAVVAFLVMALVPMTALAADGDVTLTGAGAATGTSYTVYGVQGQTLTGVEANVAGSTAVPGSPTENDKYYTVTWAGDASGLGTAGTDAGATGVALPTADQTVGSSVASKTATAYSTTYSSGSWGAWTAGSSATLNITPVKLAKTEDPAAFSVGAAGTTTLETEWTDDHAPSTGMTPAISGTTFTWTSEPALPSGALNDTSTGGVASATIDQSKVTTADTYTITCTPAPPSPLTAANVADTGKIEFTLTVNEATAITFQTGSKTASVVVGADATLTADITNAPADATVVWESSDTDTATVTNDTPAADTGVSTATTATGTVTGVASGNPVTITVKLMAADGTTVLGSDTATATVTAAAQSENATVEVEPKTATIEAGDTKTFSVTVTGATLPTWIDWTTDDISTDGTALTISPARTEINDASGTASVTVTVPATATAKTVTLTATLAGSTVSDSSVITVTAAPNASASASASASTSASPTVNPGVSAQPSSAPVAPPVSSGSTAPSASPSASPSSAPSVSPSTEPSSAPSGSASAEPSAVPSEPVELAPDAPEDLEVEANPAGEGSILTGIAISDADETTAVESLADWIEAPEGGRVEILDADGQPAEASAPVATGMIIEVIAADGSVQQSTVVVVKGDVIGSGEMSLTQLVRMAQAYTGTDPLTGVYEAAADLNGDGQITLTDLVIEAQMFRNAGLTMNN